LANGGKTRHGPALGLVSACPQGKGAGEEDAGAGPRRPIELGEADLVRVLPPPRPSATPTLPTPKGT